MNYSPNPHRYDSRVPYRRCGQSGLQLPAVTLGLWHNFGDSTPFDTQRAMLRTAFDAGITHFDMANNYGPPAGSAEIKFGEHLRRDFRPYRDELIISTKAGYDMWPGPYGQGGGSASMFWPAWTRACAAWAWTTWTFFTHKWSDWLASTGRCVRVLIPESK